MYLNWKYVSFKLSKKCLKNVKIQIFNCRKHHALPFESLTPLCCSFFGRKTSWEKHFSDRADRRKKYKAIAGTLKGVFFQKMLCWLSDGVSQQSSQKMRPTGTISSWHKWCIITCNTIDVWMFWTEINFFKLSKLKKDVLIEGLSKMF